MNDIYQHPLFLGLALALLLSSTVSVVMGLLSREQSKLIALLQRLIVEQRKLISSYHKVDRLNRDCVAIAVDNADMELLRKQLAIWDTAEKELLAIQPEDAATPGTTESK